MMSDVRELEFGCGSLEDAMYYREGAQNLIAKLVPSTLFDAPAETRIAAKTRFQDLLPFFATSDLSQAPCNLSIQLLCKYRQNACQFFYEMISRWLLPHKRVNVELFFASDVRIPQLSDDLLSVAEMVIQVKSHQELDEVQKNLKQIETEIRLGVISHYHARRILEFKGLSSDGKTAMIQEKIGSLIQSRSKDTDRGIFSQMQHFLVTCPEEFKTHRDYHHISRIISNLYSLQKQLAQNIEVLPTKRHVILKLLKTRLALSKEETERSVLGILTGLNFLNEHEVFEQTHFALAVLKTMPHVRVVEGSFFADRARDRDSSIQANYLEIEKEDGSEFSHEEIHQLRVHLPEHLQTHIERLTHPIFMPRNEEEVVRNIMALSRQLRSVTDIPQLVISFEEQRLEEVCFTIILLRVAKPGSVSLNELFLRAESDLMVAPDRIRRVGPLGRKHYKEATVFRVRIGSRRFLRADYSVDLYQARQYVVSEITRALGEVRDFNGGMIGKQSELLSALKAQLGRIADQHGLLLERFFYSLNPMEMRSVMNAELLKQFFLLLVQAQKEQRIAGKWLLKQEEKRIYAVLSCIDTDAKNRVIKALETLELTPYQLISFSIELQEIQSIGFLLQQEDPAVQKLFLDAIEQSVQ